MLKIAALTTLALGVTCAGQNRFSLTDAQRQNFSNLRQQHRQNTEASLQELHTKERTLRDQLRAGNTDAAALGRMVIDIENSRRQMAVSRTTLREQMVSSLSADQKARLKVLEEARSLAPAIREAERLGLLEAPEPPPMDAPGPMRFGRGGPRPERRFE